MPTPKVFPDRSPGLAIEDQKSWPDARGFVKAKADRKKSLGAASDSSTRGRSGEEASAHKATMPGAAIGSSRYAATLRRTIY